VAMTSTIATGTLEGILAVENAEILSGIIILRLINKKSRFATGEYNILWICKQAIYHLAQLSNY